MIVQYNGERMETQIYDENNNYICKLNGSITLLSVFCYNKKSSLIATQSNINDEILIWDMNSGVVIKRLFPNDFTLCMMFDYLGKYLITGNDAGIMRIWDINEGKLKEEKILSVDYIFFIGFTPNGKYLVIGEPKNIIILDGESYELLKKLRCNYEKIYTIIFSADNNLFATNSWENRIDIWSIRDGKLIKSLEDENQFIDVKFSSNNIIGTKHFNDIVKVWKLERDNYILSYQDKKFNKKFTINWEIRKIKLDREYKKLINKLLYRMPREIMDKIINEVRHFECLTLNNKILYITD